VPQSANPPELQAHETTQPFRIRAERNLVVVRVVVRDAQGRTVGDLHKADFRLFDEGKPQKITGFSVEVSNAKPEAAPTRVAPSATAVAPPPVVVPQRFVGLFFDDFHTEIEGIGRTRDAAWSYVTKSVRPQDRVAIFTATGKDHLDFTDDQGKLHDGLFRLVPRPHPPNDCPVIDDYEAYLVEEMHAPDALAIVHNEAIRCDCGITSRENDPVTERPAIMFPVAGGGDPCPQMAMRRVEFDAAAVWSEAEMRSQYSLQAIERSVRRLAGMPGQRSLVLVSPGFLTETQRDRIDAIVNRALQQEVVINAINATGLAAPDLLPVTNAGRPDLEARKALLINSGAVAASGVLAYLSADTGGIFFHKSNDFDEGFRQAAAVPEAYYMLTFSPQSL
jgi:VWFA-related protein